MLKLLLYFCWPAGGDSSGFKIKEFVKKLELLTSFLTLLNAFLVTLWHQSLILSQIQWNVNIFFIIAKFRKKKAKN